MATSNPFHHLSNETTKGQAILALGSGVVSSARAQSVLTMSGTITDRETLTIAGDVFELVDLSTDSTFDIGTAWDNTDAVVTQTHASNSFWAGQYVAVESEIAMVSYVNGDEVTFSRMGQAGTTVAAHSTGTDPIEVQEGTALTAGATPVPVLSTTAADMLANLAAVVGGASTSAWEVVKLSATVGLIRSTVSGARAAAVATDMANGAVDATTYNGAAASVSPTKVEVRVPTAAEVTAGDVYVTTDFVPSYAIVEVRATAGGAVIAWDGAVSIDAASRVVTVDNSGAVDWSASHTVSVVVFGVPVACSEAAVVD